MKYNSILHTLLGISVKTENLAANSSVTKKEQNRRTLRTQVVQKTVNLARKNLSDWRSAQRAALNPEKPRRTKLIQIFNDILLDGHLTSQIELRFSFTEASQFKVTVNGKEDNDLRTMFRSSAWYERAVRLMLESRVTHGHSLGEFSYNNDRLNFELIPRENVVPEHGLFMPDYSEDRQIEYRTLPEYGRWLVEFGDATNFGLLDKAVPHVYFKRFAQGAWSDLCEIYGIPPRTLKTDTTNTERVNQAESMLSAMGSASWQIIDTDESLEVAEAIGGNGDIYDKFMSFCKDEISLIILGAVVGQDTKHGGRSKEESSIELIKGLVRRDKAFVERQMNDVLIPALVALGVVPNGTALTFSREVDTAALWLQVEKAMQCYDFDIDWLNETFGMKIVGKRETQQQSVTLNASDRFFV